MSYRIRLALARTVNPYEGEPTPAVPPVVPPVIKTYTQAELTAEVNKAQQTEKQAWQKKNADTIRQLEEFKGRATTSEEDRLTLQTRIDQLTAESQTKEEQQKSELGKLQTRYDKDVQTRESERDSWKRRFEDTLFGNEVANACNTHGAFDADQIDALLRPRKKTVEEIGADGKPNGIFVSKVSFPAKDKDGKSVILELPVGDAIKMMKDMPDKYGNLFKSTSQPGFGGNNEFNAAGVSNADIDTMGDVEYEKKRLTILTNSKPSGN